MAVFQSLTYWNFNRISLDVQLTLERLVETVSGQIKQEEQTKGSAEESLTRFCLALFDPAFSVGAKRLINALLKDLDTVVLNKVRLLTFSANLSLTLRHRFNFAG